MPATRLEILFNKYLQRNATATELQELSTLLQQADAEEQLTPQMQTLWNTVKEQNIQYPVDWETVYQNITGKKEQTPVIKIFPWRRWVVAASILLVIGLSSYFLFFNKPAKHDDIAQTQSQRFKNDILPSNQGAVLTLANGQTILLDSAANGVLTNQGNVNVTKQGQQIVYTGNAGAAIVYNTMSTQKGKQYMLLLADGSKAYLNAASSITYPTAFVGSERKVEVSGEVYFEVAHNAAMPFVVSKGETSVQVLGTHFNVKAYSDDDDIKVTLLEGSVNVSLASLAIKIKPGQQALVSKDDINVSEVNTEKTMAWKNNLFWFDNEDMPSIMRELSRWYDAEIVFEEKVTSRYGFVLDRKLPISKLLQVLELTGGVHFIIEGKKVTVMK